MATRVATVGGRSNRSVVWAEDFLFAGSSALLLLVAGAGPRFRYLAFVALVPFLYRIVRSRAGQSLRLGFLLALAYFPLTPLRLFDAHPFGPSVGIAAGVLLLGGFAWAVAVSCRWLGNSPIAVALLWTALEYGFIQFGYDHGLLAQLDTAPGFLHRVGILFGFLGISFAVVLFNAVVALAVDAVAALIRRRRPTFPVRRSRRRCRNAIGLPAQTVRLIADCRGPPHRGCSRSTRPLTAM